MFRRFRLFVLATMAVALTGAMAACFSITVPKGTLLSITGFEEVNYDTGDAAMRGIINYFGNPLNELGAHLAIGGSGSGAYADFHYSSAIRNAINAQLSSNSYDDYAYCSAPGGTTHTQQEALVADAFYNIANLNKPTIVLGNGRWVMLAGAYWDEDVFNGSIRVNGFRVYEGDDPYNYSAGTYMSAYVLGNSYISDTGGFCYRQIADYGMGSYIPTYSDWADYDDWGGTYYGDEDPPDCPNCATPNAPVLSKLWTGAKSLLGSKPKMFASRNHLAPVSSSRLAAPLDAPRMRRRVMGAGLRVIPVVDPKSKSDVATDFWAGLRVTKQMSMLRGHDEKDTIVESVEFVKALRDTDRDYYRILVTDMARTPVAIGAVDARGFLIAYTTLEPQRTAPSRLLAKADAVGIAEEMGIKATDATLVYGGGTVTANLLNPVWQLIDGKAAVYVDTLRRVYRADKAGPLFMTAGKNERIPIARIK